VFNDFNHNIVLIGRFVMNVSSYYRSTCSDIPLYLKKATKKYKPVKDSVFYKLTDDEVKDIRIKYQHEKMTLSQISLLYPQVSKGHISRIIRYEVRAKIDVW
jgi:hypothetical protein